jgi:hypothetical protein
VIENSRQNNYFSEKLIDCLITKTIPIFYGAPNISSYFNTTGWIILENENIDECLNKIDCLNDIYYSKYIDIIEENYQECIKNINLSYKERLYKLLKHNLQ